MIFKAITGDKHFTFERYEIGEDIVLLYGQGKFEINPEFIHRICRADYKETPASIVAGLAVVKILRLCLLLRRFGASPSDVLLTGGAALWLFYRVPFRDLDFIAVDRILNRLHPTPFSRDYPPLLDFCTRRTLERVHEIQRVKTVQMLIGSVSMPVICPLHNLAARAYNLDPERFKNHDLSIIRFVVSRCSAQQKKDFQLILSQADTWYIRPSLSKRFQSNLTKIKEITAQTSETLSPLYVESSSVELLEFLPE